MTSYAAIAHIAGHSSKKIDLTSKSPWIYVIAAVKHQIIYVGETHDDNGILMRLISHFGPYTASTLKKNSEEKAGTRNLKPPFVVCAARLPLTGEPALFDGTSNKVRRDCEHLVQQYLIENFVLSNNWVIVSNTSGGAAYSSELLAAAEDIGRNVIKGIEYVQAMTPTNPFHMILLDPYPNLKQGELSVAEMLEELEITLFRTIFAKLEKKHGAKEWWRNGIPEDTRVNCQGRRERDDDHTTEPAEAYLMLMDAKAIAKKNWDCCGDLMEAISHETGKDKATAWLQDVNRLRIKSAHPIRSDFKAKDDDLISKIGVYLERCRTYIRNQKTLADTIKEK